MRCPRGEILASVVCGHCGTSAARCSSACACACGGAQDEADALRAELRESWHARRTDAAAWHAAIAEASLAQQHWEHKYEAMADRVRELEALLSARCAVGTVGLRSTAGTPADRT